MLTTLCKEVFQFAAARAARTRDRADFAAQCTRENVTRSRRNERVDTVVMVDFEHSGSAGRAQPPRQLPVPVQLALSEDAWIDVIQRMDEVYADLVRYQVDLEDKNVALEDAQRFIESVLSAMSDVLLVAGVDGRIQQVNNALLRLLGTTREALIGRRLADLFGSASIDVATGLPLAVRHAAILDCELELVTDAGVAVPIALNCTARLDSDGTLSGVVITGRPLGELRQAYSALRDAHDKLKTAQQQLLQSEKMASLGRLVAGVAHELNNPISFVFANMHSLRRYGTRLQTYLNALHSGADSAALAQARHTLRIDETLADLDPLIDGSLEGAQRVSEIVQNLRRYATPQRQSADAVALGKVVRSSLSWVERGLRRKPRVSLALDDALEVWNYEGHLQQILINLIQNAVDAMDGIDDAHLEISAQADGGGACVCVRDHGPGIAEADLIRIFDPFFTTKEVGKGTGLGLYVSYGLATEQCGGSLQARNHPQGGAEFTLNLPQRVGHV